MPLNPRWLRSGGSAAVSNVGIGVAAEQGLYGSTSRGLSARVDQELLASSHRRWRAVVVGKLSGPDFKDQGLD